jgi:hypothetical protein
MEAILWAVLLVAGGCLIYILLRPYLNFGTLLRFIVNLAAAAVVVYVIRITGIMPGVDIVPNIPNVLIAGLLGLPGLAMLYAVHLFVFA